MRLIKHSAPPLQRQSDVEVDFGVFLSGGIDSSLVSAVTRSLHPKRPMKAYTLRFEEETFDEGNFAEAVAKQLKMEMVTVWVKPDDVRDGLKSLVRLVGEPLADPAWIPAALLARRAAQDVKLALVGEGADELFGGYPTYIGAGVAERYARLPGWFKSVIRRAVEALPPSEKKVTISFLLKRFVQGADLDGMARHRLWVSNIAPPLLARLGVTPMELENHESGRRPTAGPGAALGFGNAAGRGIAHQGRPGQHEFGAGTARAVPGRSGDGICRNRCPSGNGCGDSTRRFF